jgi:DNA invertase Pin-like site-specific DNA recombinase
MELIGYAGVNTTDRDLSIQEMALRAAGATPSAPKSGVTTQGREELQTVLDFLRLGDVLMVTRVDRYRSAAPSP